MTDDNQQPITPGMVKRESFGSTELQVTGGMQDNAIAAAMQAQIMARSTMAMRRPRNWAQVRAVVIRECQRQEFAEVAMYALPRGNKTIDGLSIRFAEMAMRAMTNLHAESNIIYDDPSKRMIQVDVSDLESNVTFSIQLIVEKTVERSSAKGNVISQRQNSQGRPVYVVRATDDEVQQKCAVLISKALRTHVLRILPGDIQDDAKATIQNALVCEPETQKWVQRVKGLVDAYAGNFRIDPVELERYLGHPMAQLTPQELVDLRLLYQSIRSGDVTWAEVMAERGADEKEGDAQTKTSRVKDLLAAKKAPAPAPKNEQQVVVSVEDDLVPEEPKPSDQQDQEDFKKTADRIVAKGRIKT